MALFIASVILALIPTCWLFQIRSANMSMSNKCETDIFIEGGYQNSQFVLHGEDYHIFDLGTPGVFELGPAVASWRKEQSVFDKVFGYTSCGNYYTVLNENGFEILSDGASKLFCSNKDFQSAQDWYSDDTNYQWYFQPLNAKPNQKIEISYIEQSTIASLSDLNKNYNKDADNILSVSISKDKGPETYHIFSQSRDGVINKDYISLEYYESEFYICNALFNEQGGTTYYFLPLPIEVNKMLNSCWGHKGTVL